MNCRHPRFLFPTAGCMGRVPLLLPATPTPTRHALSGDRGGADACGSLHGWRPPPLGCRRGLSPGTLSRVLGPGACHSLASQSRAGPECTGACAAPWVVSVAGDVAGLPAGRFEKWQSASKTSTHTHGGKPSLLSLTFEYRPEPPCCARDCFCSNGDLQRSE